jgi:hypothetical protein
MSLVTQHLVGLYWLNQVLHTKLHLDVPLYGSTVWQQVLFWWTQGTRAMPRVLILKRRLKI